MRIAMPHFPVLLIDLVAEGHSAVRLARNQPQRALKLAVAERLRLAFASELAELAEVARGDLAKRGAFGYALAHGEAQQLEPPVALPRVRRGA